MKSIKYLLIADSAAESVGGGGGGRGIVVSEISREETKCLQYFFCLNIVIIKYPVDKI